MIAALPMYDRPELRAETDRLWDLLRDGLRVRGIRAPDALTRGADVWDIWQSAELVFAQTCGLPYRAKLADHVSLIGAPIHAGGPAGHYHSVIIARPGPLPDAPRLAVNDALSQSGWANLQPWAKDHGTITVTGAHYGSARAVYDGKADLAAIDAVTWGFMRRWDDWTDALKVVAESDPVPALPYIAPPGADIAAYQDAFDEAVAGLGQAGQEALNLYGLARLTPPDYTRLPLPPALQEHHGLP